MSTHKIILSEYDSDLDGHVVIKAKRSWKARQILDGARFLARPGGGNDETPLDLAANVFGYRRAILETAVVEWTLKDAEGKPLPASRAGFEHDDFDPDLGDWIVDAIEAYYEGLKRPPEEDSNLATSSPKPSAEPADGPAS